MVNTILTLMKPCASNVRLFKRSSTRPETNDDVTTSGSAQIPIWFEPLDGNSQDKTNFHNTLACIKAFRNQLAQAPELTVVAFSPLLNSNRRFITG